MPMPMSMQEWDTTMAPVLYRIIAHAQNTARQARFVQGEVQYLMYRPPWLSKAEAQIDQALAECEAAVDCLRKAKEHYAKKEARE